MGLAKFEIIDWYLMSAHNPECAAFVAAAQVICALAANAQPNNTACRQSHYRIQAQARIVVGVSTTIQSQNQYLPWWKMHAQSI